MYNVHVMKHKIKTAMETETYIYLHIDMIQGQE